ncbi:MAG: sodium:calcium antiporter [Gemmatimonadaceae bacterium]
MKSKLLIAAAANSAATAWSAIWTFPSILLSAFVIAWAAEAAQFLVSQGLALAILAWLQTLPEFAVEAVIAWQAGKDPISCFVADPPSGCHSHLAIANYTGAIRLLVGLGWPMIYFVAAFFRARRKDLEGRALSPIILDPEHSVEVLATIPPVLYFFIVWAKGSLGLLDAGILLAMYAGYLAILWRFPPHSEEELADAPAVARWAYTRPGPWRGVAITGLFLVGGFAIYFTAHPFLNSMLAVAASLGISQFVFVQWVAPFLSEFPEKVSAFQWASRVTKAPMALVNMLSSNVNQWTVLAAMIPIVFSLSRGEVAELPFDGVQRMEILLTILQSIVAVLLLINMKFEWWNAGLLFLLWLVQFLVADWREELSVAYSLWAVGLILSWFWIPPAAPQVFWNLVKRDRAAIAQPNTVR